MLRLISFERCLLEETESGVNEMARLFMAGRKRVFEIVFQFRIRLIELSAGRIHGDVAGEEFACV